ncbi:PID-CTERM protein-sorting domain-containing protein [Wenyingzhuangia sp. IMCC45467]
MKIKTYKILILLVFGVVYVASAAPGPPPPPPPPGLPIDMGVVFLVLAAVGLGITKLRKQTL